MLWQPVSLPVPPLSDHAIHVYSAALDAVNVAALEPLLSDDERTRAARFRFAVHRQRFIARRGILRRLLSQYVNLPPLHIRFAYTVYDKPYLPDSDIGFNQSSADNLALYAFARGVSPGIDIEQIKALPDMDDVAQRMFSARENALYRALPAAQKAAGFYNCWTRKEAFIKAIGEGLSFPLADFEVTLKPGDPPALLAIRGDSRAGGEWHLADLDPAPGYCGALAIHGQARHINCFMLADTRFDTLGTKNSP